MPATEPTAAPELTTVVYQGEGVHRKTFYRSADDSERVCETRTDMEVRLEPDGTATITYSVGIRMVIEEDEKDCIEIDGGAWPGKWDAAGSFTIPQPSDGLGTWEVDGSFDEEAAFGSVYYTSFSQGGDAFIRDIIEFEFTLDRVD